VAETDATLKAAIQCDFENEKSFGPDTFMKDKQDIEDCKTILTKNMTYIQQCFIENISISENYPRIDF
jgi:hypothetical protein